MTILWDWNGTLLSDVPLVVKINNEVFARHGYRLTSEEEYRQIFRFPVKDYYTDIGVTDEDFPLVAKEWNEGYVANFHLAQLHQTAAEAVHRFHDAGFHQAIISASQVDQLRAQVVKFPELDGMFDDILGWATSTRCRRCSWRRITFRARATTLQTRCFWATRATTPRLPAPSAAAVC